jgi:hypothetical protein
MMTRSTRRSTKKTATAMPSPISQVWTELP